MLEFIIIIISSLLNRAAGWGIAEGEKPSLFKSYAVKYFGKATSACAIGVLFAVYLSSQYGFSDASMSGFLIACGWISYRGIGGWGDYWDGSQKPNDEISVIDWVVSDLLKIPSGLRNDVISMALRGWFGVLPLFIGLAAHNASAWVLVWSLAGLSQGFVYHGWRIYLKPNEFDMQSQLSMGAIISAAILCAV